MEMTEQVTATDRLHEHIADFHGNCPWVGEDHTVLLNEALAEAAGAPLREALFRRIAEELDAHGLGSHSKPSECQAGAVLNEVRALAATPIPAPLDAGDCAGTHHYGLCTSCGSYITQRIIDSAEPDHLRHR